MLLKVKVFYKTANSFLTDVSIHSANEAFTGVSIHSDELHKYCSDEQIEMDNWDYENDFYHGEFDNEFVCVSTSLKDSKNLDIYENDIIVNRLNEIFLVEYSQKELSFLFRSLSNRKIAYWTFLDNQKPFTIIGHKFDKKNLFD